MDDRWKGTQCLNTFTVANSSLGDKKTTECRGFLSESGRNIAATPVFHARERQNAHRLAAVQPMGKRVAGGGTRAFSFSASK